MRLLAQDYASVYTTPDRTLNRSTFVNLESRHSWAPSLTLTANAYFRDIRANTTNGDLNNDSLGASGQVVWLGGPSARRNQLTAARPSTPAAWIFSSSRSSAISTGSQHHDRQRIRRRLPPVRARRRSSAGAGRHAHVGGRHPRRTAVGVQLERRRVPRRERPRSALRRVDADGIRLPGESPAYAVVNAGVRYTFSRHFELSAQVDNVFDHHYYTAAQLNATGFTSTGIVLARPFPAIGGEFPIEQSTFYAPGAPTTAWVALRVGL